FKEKPPTPPSTAALFQEETGSYFRGVVRLMKNCGYVLLLISYGMNVGAFYAISTLLNQVVLSHFPVSETRRHPASVFDYTFYRQKNSSSLKIQDRCYRHHHHICTPYCGGVFKDARVLLRFCFTKGTQSTELG
ncbi:hypothetical protein SK128_003970, partial [Halocaridina rubra]